MTFASQAEHIPPGWYVHPHDPAWQQYWDGGAWTSSIAPLARDPRQRAGTLLQDVPTEAPEADEPEQLSAGESHAVLGTHSLKETGTAYTLAILLSTFGGHQFYLGNFGAAIGFAVLWWGGLVLNHVGGIAGVSVYYGSIAVIAAVIWWVVDLCTLPLQVAAANRRIVADLR